MAAPGSARASADAPAERLRATVAALAIPLGENDPHGIVTISLGVNLIGREDMVTTDNQWLERSDKARYEAKASGRNMVVAAVHDVSEPPRQISAA